MGNLLSPDIPGPTAEETALKKSQVVALEKERLAGEKADSKERVRDRKSKAGQIGLRSLLSGGFGGMKLGG